MNAQPVTIKALKERIQTSIESSDKAVIRAILLVYENQTSEEQEAERTLYHNSVGFSGTDAEILSSFAVQVQDWQSTHPTLRRFSSPLSIRQMAVARRLAQAILVTAERRGSRIEQKWLPISTMDEKEVPDDYRGQTIYVFGVVPEERRKK